MKKLLSILLIFAVLLSCCACEKKEGEGTTAPTLDPASPEAMYGNIDQFTPIDGVYKLWNAEGVKNMVNHPDANFEILCNIDMGGAVLKPVGTADKPFTGNLNGANFTISNFTLQGGEEADFGFVGVNRGSIQNLLLDQATFIPGANARNIGSLTGSNEGQIQRCTVTGALTVKSAAADAICGSLVGKTTTDIVNTVTNVDLSYTAAGKATVAGIAGSAEGCKLEFLETNGKLEITGSDKTVALFVGNAKSLNINTLAFVGAVNAQDGKLFENYFGTEEKVAYVNLLVRENDREPENPVIQAKRQQVVDYMNACATITWKVRHDMLKSSTSCQCSSCHGMFSAIYTYIGPPYNHKASSLYRMQYAIDEEGYLKEFVEYAGAGDGFDMYIGTDCSTSTSLAYQTVSTTVCYSQTQDQVPAFNKGTYPVGDYQLDPSLNINNTHKTKNHIEYNGEEVMMESYAQMRMGDSIVYWDDGAGHSRMATSDAVVVRDENGKISPTYSYILMSEQGGGTQIDEETKEYTTWAINRKYTFGNLYGGYYLPTTIQEFITGEFEEIDCKLEGAVSDSRLGLTSGVITSNYAIDSVTMVITDENGEEVYNHRIFTTSSKMVLDGSNHSRNRAICNAYNMASFATPLQQQVAFTQGGSYHATIYANLMTGDEILVHDFSFVNGQA